MTSTNQQRRNEQGPRIGKRLHRRVSYSALGAVGALLATMVPFQAMAAPVTINIADAETAKAITINVGGQTAMAGNGNGVVINLADSSAQDGVVINIGNSREMKSPTVVSTPPSVARPVRRGATNSSYGAGRTAIAAGTAYGAATAVANNEDMIPTVAPVAKPIGGTMPTSTFMAVPSATTTTNSAMNNTVTTPATTSRSGAANGDMRVRLNELAPNWAQDTLRALAGDGRLGATKASDITNSITRKEGATLTARAYNLMRRQEENRLNGNGSQTPVNSVTNQRIQALVEEFMPELQAMGFGSMAVISDTQPGEGDTTPLKLGGEVRYNNMHNTGDKGYNYNDNRWRVRLHADKQITDQWSVHGLAEFDHSSLSGTDADSVVLPNTRDGKVRLSRLYAEGTYRWFDIPFIIDAGRTYAYLANGTLLDSDFKGVTVTAQPAPNLTISAGHGQVNSNQKMTYIEGVQRRGIMDYMAGYYRWNHYGDPVTILYGGMNYYIGNYTLTGQYLGADKADGSGAKDGYQATIKYGKDFSWIPHTYEFNLDYYDLPGTTYITHTMNGLGNWMNGFTGWGARFYYTLHPNVMVSLQYYDLQDKTTKQKGRTLWSEINWGF